MASVSITPLDGDNEPPKDTISPPAVAVTEHPVDVPSRTVTATVSTPPRLSSEELIFKEQDEIRKLIAEATIDKTETVNGSGYAGDRADKTPPSTGQYKTFQFDSPFDIVTTFDRQINQGLVTVHKWQMEVNEFLAAFKPTSNKALRFCLCAANGSGKDAYVIAPFVIWFLMTKVRSLCVVTSSSGVQLTAQTENYIAALANQVNHDLGYKVFKINKRYIKCLETGSEVRMFATDEAGKAEGYHPLEPNAEMAIIVNEAKTVTPEIFTALSRCTGYNYWLNVSTPGEPYGDFHDSFENWEHKRRITAFDCPHLSEDHINEMKRKYGEQSFVYRSQILALFTAVGGKTVIDQDRLNELIKACARKEVPKLEFGKKRLAFDLAAGRDECVFVATLGNVIKEWDCFVERDTTITEARMEAFMRKHGAEPNSDAIELIADDGGLGHAIIDRLVSKGWRITRVLNQSRAINNTQFGNRGAEMWFNIARLIEEKVLHLELNTNLFDDRKLYEQLCFRYYKKNETSGKVTLESKEEARSNGHTSPDRADALVLAFSIIDFYEFSEEIKKRKPQSEEPSYTVDQLREQKFASHREKILTDPNKNSKYGMSIEHYLASRNN